MSRRAKTDRVPRTRAGGTWTEAAFWGYLRSGLRQLSKRWPPRRQALIDARVPYEGPNTRRKWEYLCAKCKRLHHGRHVQVDHVVPCGSLRSWEDLAPFAQRLFCEVEGFQVLCKSCHHRGTQAQREAA